MLLLVAGLSLSGCSRVAGSDLTRTFEHTTPVYDVDQIYPSMGGPEYTNKSLELLGEVDPELLWITGYEAVMVAPDGKSQKSQEFMCHNTLTIHRGLDDHRKLFGSVPYGTRRLFTLSQGQYEVELPEGFGIPVVSSERLMLQSQVLNLNESAIGEKVRHKVKTRFVRESERAGQMKPLCMFPSGIGVRVGDPDSARMPDDPVLGCAVPADDGSPGRNLKGEVTTGHWLVRPGRDERYSDLGHHFPFDTTVHYIAVHVHPFAESFEFRDRTTGESLWTARAQQSEGSIGLKSLTHYSSKEGIPVYRDHEYEIISVYNNTTDQDQTAMAFMFFYVLDTGFSPPTSEALARSHERFLDFNKPPAMLR